MEHDEESNKHGKQDHEFKADDLTSGMSKQLVQDSEIVAVVKHEYYDFINACVKMSILDNFKKSGDG